MANGYLFGHKQKNKAKYWEDFANDGRRTNQKKPAQKKAEKVTKICVSCLVSPTRKNKIGIGNAKHCQECWEKIPEVICSCGKNFRYAFDADYKYEKLCYPCNRKNYVKKLIEKADKEIEKRKKTILKNVQHPTHK